MLSKFLFQIFSGLFLEVFELFYVLRSQALTRTFCVNSIHLSVPGGFPLTRTIAVNSFLFTLPGEFAPKRIFLT